MREEIGHKIPGSSHQQEAQAEAHTHTELTHRTRGVEKDLETGEAHTHREIDTAGGHTVDGTHTQAHRHTDTDMKERATFCPSK